MAAKYLTTFLLLSSAYAARFSNSKSERSQASQGTCAQNGALVCNGQQYFGLCNSGKVTWQSVAAGTCCDDGKITACAQSGYSGSQSSSSSSPSSAGGSSSSCYNGGGPTATIDIGVVHGTTTSLPSATGAVNKFLGIQFAQSPPTRFAPPQQAQSVSSPINATAFKPACVQQFVYPKIVQDFTKYIFNTPGGAPPPEESEDCLYLNVYAPSTPAPCDGRAVLFWIYGGNWEFGTAGIPFYDGSSFAAYEDVIVVSVNYRTNVFGFATSPEIPIQEQNLGFLDQRLALDWVQKNIRAFGGSPDKVTLFGESAGAFSIDALLTSYNKNDKVPFRGAILESGQISYNMEPRPSTYDHWYNLASALNCSTSTSNLTCIRAANATTIKSIIEQQELNFNPAWDNRTFFVDAAERRLRGEIPNIPVLGGSNSQEGRVFEVSQTDSRPFVETIAAYNETLINEILAAYPLSAPDSGPLPYDQLSQIFTEFVFQCPAAKWANASAQAGIPTWRYIFNSSFMNTQPVPSIAALGAYHSAEIPLVFGTYPELNTTTQEYALSNFIQSTWAKFAKNPMGGPGWNPVGTGAAGTILLGAEPTGIGGVYKGQNSSVLSGAWNLGILGNRLDVVTSGVSVIDSQEVDYRCHLFEQTYNFIQYLDEQSAAQERAAAGVH